LNTKNNYKVLLLDGVDAICETIFRDRGIEAHNSPALKGEELLKVLPEYHGIVVRSATKVTPELLNHAPELKVVGRAGVGVDNVDIDEATKRGILVMNTPDGNTISTAEHTCALILALARNIPDAVQSLKNGAWDRKKYMGSELHGKTLGIIGLGKIGSTVARRMKSFGMKIYAYDPFTTHEKAAEMDIHLLELDEILRTSDFLTVHTPLTDKTRGLVSVANRNKLKKGIRLVNCARGGIFEEHDLLTLLDDGIVGGVALDVYTTEPPTDELYQILKHPGVICTPHLGASTEEAQEKVAEQIAHQMADALERKSYIGSLNGKSIALSMNKEVQPFLIVAEKLGFFASQIAPANTTSLDVEYSGTCAEHAEVLTDSVLKGFLTNTSESPVNLINARFLADSKGVKVREASSRTTRTYHDLITITLNDRAPYRRLSATPFGENDFRIVEIDGYNIEQHLAGEMVIYSNIDRPGMLAAVSSAFASKDINIASLSLGRQKKDSSAVTVVTVDRKLTSAEISEIDKIEGVEKVCYISL
jgi:D-3-phosphoglycerate dehydrogenase / 2-oxoglutarate reductase